VKIPKLLPLLKHCDIEALRQRKATLEAKTPPSERIKPLQGRLRALGGKDVSFDMKAFSDEINSE